MTGQWDPLGAFKPGHTDLVVGSRSTRSSALVNETRGLTRLGLHT